MKFGEPDSAGNAADPILANEVIFGTNLLETPLKEKIESAFREMLLPGGVRKSLQRI